MWWDRTQAKLNWNRSVGAVDESKQKKKIPYHFGKDTESSRKSENIYRRQNNCDQKPPKYM